METHEGEEGPAGSSAAGHSQICSTTSEDHEPKLENSPQDCVGDGQLYKLKAEVQLDMLKTSLCSYFRKSNTCRHGDKCRYAHGESELRPKPDGSWDPTSEQGKRTSEVEEHVLQDDDNAFSEVEEDEGNLRKCVRDLPPRWSSEDLKKLLIDQGLAFRTTKKRKRFHVGFVEFESDEQVALAKQKLDGLRVHSKEVKITDVLPRAWEKKQGNNQTGISADAENPRSETEATTKPTDICDVVTPFARFTYEEQLKKKNAEIAKVLKRLVRNVRKAVSSKVPLPDWITSARLEGRDVS